MVVLPPTRHETKTMAGLSLAVLMTSLDTSMVNTSLPALARAYDAPFQQAQWIVLAYLLVVTSLAVALGRLGDIVNRRRLLIAGVGLFLVASPLCALSSSIWALVAARAAQGTCAAAIVSMAFALAGDLEPGSRGAAMGRLTSMSAVGTMLGPTVASTLSHGPAGSIFLVNIPIAIVSIVLLARRVPAASPRPDAPRIAPLETLLLALTLGTYALSVTYGKGTWTAVNSTLIVICLAAAAAFWRVERVSTSPLIPISALHDPRLTSALAANAVVTTMVMASLIVGPFYLAKGLSLSPAIAGLVLSAGPATAALTSALAGRRLRTTSTTKATAAGLAMMTTGAVLLAVLPRASGIAGYVASLVLLTAGYAAFQTANGTAIMTAAGGADRGVVAGLLGLSRNLGLITGTAVMGTIFRHATGASDPSSASPGAIAAGLHGTFAVAALVLAAALTLSLVHAARGRASLALSRSITPKGHDHA